jgi:hypothetical protein
MRHVQAISLFLKLVLCEQAMAVARVICRGVVECVALLVWSQGGMSAHIAYIELFRRQCNKIRAVRCLVVFGLSICCSCAIASIVHIICTAISGIVAYVDVSSSLV